MTVYCLFEMAVAFTGLVGVFSTRWQAEDTKTHLAGLRLPSGHRKYGALTIEAHSLDTLTPDYAAALAES